MAVGTVRKSAVVTAGLLVALVGVAGLPACREEPDALQAVRRASTTINAVAGGAEAAVAIDVQDRAFQEALKQLDASTLDPQDPLASATGILRSASQLGTAGAPTSAAQTSLTTLSNLRSELRSALSQWTMFSSVAEASTYDAAPRLAELDAQLTAAKGELSAAEGRMAALQTQQDKLLADARDKADQAKKLEAQSVVLKEQASTLTASQAQPVLTQALEIRGRCDELRLAVARIEADATLLEPQKLQVRQREEELKIGIASLEAERVRVAKRGTESSAAESEARAKAAQAAADLDDLAKKIAEEREKNLSPALEEVIGVCKKAASSAAAVKGDGKVSVGRILSAKAKHRLGEVLLLKAGEANDHAALMSQLAAAAPALPAKASFEEAGKAAAEAGKAAIAEAREALEGARNDFKSIPARDEADEAAKLAVIKYLTRIGGLEPDESESAPPPAAEGEPGEGEKPAGDPAPTDTANAGEAEVRAFLKDLAAKIEAGDAEALAAAMHLGEGKAEQAATLASMTVAGAKLDAACKTKFDKTLTQALKESPMGAAAGQTPGSVPTASEIENAAITVNGDAATVTVEGGQPSKFAKIGGSWKIDLSEIVAAPGALDMLIEVGGAATKAADETTAEVEADKYDSIDAVLQAYMGKMMKAMMPAGGPEKEDAGGGKGGQGGGGGGNGG
jgi:hypothetical protein